MSNLDTKTLIALLGAVLGVLGGGSVIHQKNESDATVAFAIANQQATYEAGFQLCREMAFGRRDAGKERIIPRVPENLTVPEELELTK